MVGPPHDFCAYPDLPFAVTYKKSIKGATVLC